MTSLLVTGGTGTIGQAVVEQFLCYNTIHKVVVFSRDEYKQWEMRKRIPDPRLRFFLGDIRDAERIRRACEDIDYVVHAAALKQIDTGVSNPMEFAKTNVDGSMNVINAVLDCCCDRLVAISTDKAVEPTCLYGATKLVMEGLVSHAKAYVGQRQTTFGIVRMGNIAFSRGSVIPYFLQLKKEGKSLPVTSMEMTRYWVDKEDASNLISDSVFSEKELLTPEAVAFRMSDLVQALDCPYHIVGLRDQERLYEKLDTHRSSHYPDRFLTVDEIRQKIGL